MPPKLPQDTIGIMRIRNLDSLFTPTSIAVIGASDCSGREGATV